MSFSGTRTGTNTSAPTAAISGREDAVNQYSVMLQGSDTEWAGTFAAIVRFAATDLLSDGEPYGPVEILLHDHSPLVTGVLSGIDGDDLVIGIADQVRRIGVDEVERLRF